jgi:putative membrane protein
MLRSAIGGFFMGTADLVPGVSGGTIALVIGVYSQLVTSIREGSSALGSVLKGDFTGFRQHLRAVEWAFLVPLLSGILLAIVLLASFLEQQLEERPIVIAGLFLGLVVGSIVIAWRLLRRPNNRHVALAVTVGIVLFLLLGFGEGQVSSDPSMLAFFGAGALAICAMILPGISGSLILLMLGMYAPVLAAVTDRDFGTIAIFALGAVIGLALFSQVLYWSLEHHHDNVLAALIGLMAGSTRILWPWPEGVASAELGAPGDDWVVVLVAGLVGAVAVSLLSRLAMTRDS